MKNKKIFVIDDEGDVLNFVSEAFKDNSKIEIFGSKSDFDELNRKFKKDFSLILINKDNIKNDLRLLINFIKNHLFYLIIPVLVLTNDEEYIKNQNVLDFPILNYISKSIKKENFKVRMEYVLEIIDYNQNINDISHLPNSDIIDRRILEEMDRGSKFAFVYIDLDNFKEYNDYYGLYGGNEVLLFLSNTLQDVISEIGTLDDFIGHVGGDDFIIILNDCKNVEKIGNEVIRRFDEGIIQYYDSEDLANGYIEVMDRSGVVEKIGIMSISIVSIDYNDFNQLSFDDIYRKIMKIKKEAKCVEGSFLLQK